MDQINASEAGVGATRPAAIPGHLLAAPTRAPLADLLEAL
jgi:hypothetical protein